MWKEPASVKPTNADTKVKNEKLSLLLNVILGQQALTGLPPGKPRDEVALFISSFKVFKWYYFAALKSMNRGSLR